MKSSFTRNLQIGFSISLLLLIISSVASFVSIQNLLRSAEMVNHTNQVLDELANVLSVMKDAETGQRGYLLTGEEQFLTPYTGAYERSLVIVNNVKTLTVDNPVQQQNCDALQKAIINRLNILQNLIDLRKAGKAISTAQLQQGRSYMDETRNIIQRMQHIEHELLARRTERMNRFAGYTPVVIVIAAILALIITIMFYLRINRDFKEREQLQKQLQKKDREIAERIDVIQKIAGQISSGDYTIRINDEEKDGLGSLALSLNQMANSLQHSFDLLSAKEWMQTGVAGLNDKIIGEKDIKTLANAVLEFVAIYTESQTGALFLLDNEQLHLQSGYAFNAREEIIKPGEGLVGQAAASGKPILVKDIKPDDIAISFATAKIKPRNIIAIPIYHEQQIKGVLELASVNPYTEKHIEFLTTISYNIGIAIYTAQNRKRLQELLEETQSQAEELQSQHSELENLNTELEAQAQKLQASEEELKVQQEELLQANQELEERSRLLEEKNQVIVERNLDIQKKAEELEISTRYKSEFLANMSHELRTPLNSILLLSRLLSENADKNLSPDQVESAEVIQSSGKGLLSLIDEILDLSKIEAGKMELEYAVTDIDDIISDMRMLFMPIAREKNLDFKIVTSPAVPTAIETDKMRLEQILKNLLSNALKFTSRGAVTLAVEPSATAGFISFSVTDTGIGIPKEKQDHIFEAFQQADGSTRRKFGGTGLGLSISRELAKLLGGSINLNSDPGVGSKFTVIVPVKPAEQTPLPEAEKQDAEPEPIVQPEQEEPHHNIVPVIPDEIPDDRNSIDQNEKVILIVEDDTNFAKALLNFTHKRSYKGIVAVRGDHAIDMAIKYKPIAILLDIQLPVKDGWQVMEELKSNPETKHIPVHIMSSLEVKRESLLKGAVDFINKPVALEQMQQIFQTLETALNKNPRKVLIVEENPKHAQALAYFLETFGVSAEIKNSVSAGVSALRDKKVNCVILDMGIPDKNAYEALETVKNNPGLENLPIIIFTGKNLSKSEENRIKQYADSIVVKTAHSYQRILDEVGLFLHLIEENKKDKPTGNLLGTLDEVLKNKTVLIADDDIRNIFSLTKALEKHKMRVVSATDGMEALKQLQENPDVDVVLMDMMMPEMDGYETTARIRTDSRYKNLPILAVTAKAMIGDREKCISAGASDYISKPVDIDQLISLLRVWLYDKTS
ncbi:response regulator (plasmid) [Pedobacter sp. BS3]|uniref:response regulator n=1 Tax=Pedobacter sp. BS3 TaxID=2567937 RepID=UPI0011EDE43B|nr:response regulator [Pedobacter sp. BS3]TZF85891.1 response regulator [Pedobacter sp. BS3]